MYNRLLALLKDLESRVPPDDGAHHAIIYSQYGNDVEGWEDRLALALRVDNASRILFFEDGDLDKPTDAIIADIADAIRNA